MAALLSLVVLAHLKPHARGERVSAGPGVEYMVGPDGLLYQTAVMAGPKRGYRTSALPGVLPDHVETLLMSPNIREVKDYKGPVGTVAAPSKQDDEHSALVAQHAALVTAHDKLVAENAALRDQLAAGPAPTIVAPQPPPPDAPFAKPAPPPPPPAAPAGDNAFNAAAALGVSVGKFGAQVASGEFDKHLPALRAAEVAGKNRTSALAVIDARIAALA